MQRFPPHFGLDRFPDQLVSLENEHCVFLTIEPQDVLPGSGLIVPFAARATVFDLTPVAARPRSRLVAPEP